jgi:hypothetical protein
MYIDYLQDGYLAGKLYVVTTILAIQRSAEAESRITAMRNIAHSDQVYPRC